MGSPKDGFLDALCEALRNRRRNRSKEWSKERQRERSIARTLCGPLWPTAFQVEGVSADDAKVPVHSKREIESAERTERTARAERIMSLTTQLLEALPRGTLGDLIHGWSSVMEARGALTRLTQDAAVVVSRSRKRARRPVGPRPDKNRQILSQWVALQMLHAGVQPSKAKTGTFARVLCVVQTAAGYQNRTLDNVERDVRYALNSPVVKQRLIATQPPP